MTVTFENENDAIVYGLEKVITYARRTQQIFVAQCIWWIASVIGLEQELINYVDNIQSRVKDTTTAEARPKVIPRAKVDREAEEVWNFRGVLVTPRDIQEDPRSRVNTGIVHPDRRAQIQIPDDDISSLDLEGSRQENLAKETEKFISRSQKERYIFSKTNSSRSSRIRSGKVTKPLSKKQKNYLQSISKDTIAEYLSNRK